MTLLGPLLVAALLVAGCTAQPVVHTDPSPAGPPGGGGEIAAAMEFRRQFGLRADEAWVRHVAADPNADLEYGVALTQAELAELNARQRSADEVQPIVEAYAAQHRDEFGGVYIDQKAGGIFVALFTRNVAEHEAALRSQLHPRARFGVREVRWTEAELRRLQDRVARDAAWFASIGAVLTSTSIDPIGNAVEVEISSANPDAAELVVAHFGAEGRMRVDSDGTGVLARARGSIVGRVVDRDGRPVAGAMIAPTPLFEAGPMDAVGYQTADDGSFEVREVPPGPWRVDVWSDGDVVASQDVAVPPGGIGHVLVRVTEPLPAP